MAPPRAERFVFVRRTAAKEAHTGARWLPLPEGEGRGEGEGRVRVAPYYNAETSRAAGNNLECGDLSPLLPLWRLVAKAGPRPAARESRTPSCIRRRQVAYGKRGQVHA